MKISHDLEKLNFEIPKALLKYDWDNDIDINEGETANMLKVCKILTKLLAKCTHWNVTPETLSWMTLWIRNFNLLQGAISILESQVGILTAGQELTLRILWRPAFELWLTLNYIYNESANLFSNQDAPKRTLEDRMCAYLAWCIWADKEFYHKLTQGWRLDAVYGKEGAQSNQGSNAFQQGLEVLWGDEEAANESKDQEEKHLLRKVSFEQRNQLQRWLQHEKIQKFESLIKSERPRSFFELIDFQNKSVAALLRSSWIDAGYPAYQEASSLIHGTTFVNHMDLIEHSLFPHLIVDGGMVQRQAGHIRRHCKFNAVTLELIQKSMISEGLV